MQENVRKNGADGSLDCVVNVAAALHRTDTIRCFGKEADFSCAFANELSTKRQTRFPGRGYCNEPVSQWASWLLHTLPPTSGRHRPPVTPLSHSSRDASIPVRVINCRKLHAKCRIFHTKCFLFQLQLNYAPTSCRINDKSQSFRNFGHLTECEI